MKRAASRNSFRLSLAPDPALPLFTAKGEKLWVPGWNPSYIHPTSGELELDQVWTTGEGDEQSWWTCCHLDRVARSVAYVRVTPGLSIARVTVEISPDGAGSRVEVGYVVTALSAVGEEKIADFAAGFDAMLEQWRLWIEAL